VATGIVATPLYTPQWIRQPKPREPEIHPPSGDAARNSTRYSPNSGDSQTGDDGWDEGLCVCVCVSNV